MERMKQWKLTIGQNLDFRFQSVVLVSIFSRDLAIWGEPSTTTGGFPPVVDFGSPHIYRVAMKKINKATILLP